VLAQAVQSLFPDAKLGIGPPAADGFYYDFHVAEPFKPQDLEKIECECARSSKRGNDSR
jgi:threonyl-tRNA synthetase